MSCNRAENGLRGTPSWWSQHTVTSEMRMDKTLGLGRLVCTPVLGSGYLGSQHLLSNCGHITYVSSHPWLLPALKVSPKQLALGLVLPMESHKATRQTTSPHTVLRRWEGPSFVFCFAALGVRDQQR